MDNVTKSQYYNLQSQNDELRSKIVELEKDAGRYRYLRDASRSDAILLSGPEAGVWCDCEDASHTLILLTENDLDNAIDAAMAK